jgi:hypothetical protein
MKKFYLVLLLSLVLSNLAAQSKKEVIETLTFNIDSLNIVISKLRLGYITELESKESRISALKAEIVQLESDKLLYENYIDSLQKLNLELLDKNQLANSQILVLNDSLSALKKATNHESIVISDNIIQALDKVKSEWSYFMNDFGGERYLLLDSLNKICDDDRCVSFLLTDSFLIVSYRVLEVTELGTQIIELSSNLELLKEEMDGTYVEEYDKQKKILVISHEGYDSNGHFWQEGSCNLEKKTVFLGKKTY